MWVRKVDKKMVQCPKCCAEVDKPTKVFANENIFTVSEYICGKCHHRFIIAKYD
jgi:uncharacterized protein YlaI